MAKVKAKANKETGSWKAGFALFAVLLIASVLILATAVQEASPRIKGDVTVDPEGILQSYLSSTVSEVTYTDVGGNTTVYTGMTVQSLVVEDLEIRVNTTREANITSLTNGIEKTMAEMLDQLTGEHHYYLKASFRTNFVKITDTDVYTGRKAGTEVTMRTFSSAAVVTITITE